MPLPAEYIRTQIKLTGRRKALFNYSFCLNQGAYGCMSERESEKKQKRKAPKWLQRPDDRRWLQVMSVGRRGGNRGAMSASQPINAANQGTQDPHQAA